ncbi:unnamed protein product [Symbiodinium microadriaticum]|nr:unnamed protein product [Symbiodinium microadriaticum]
MAWGSGSWEPQDLQDAHDALGALGRANRATQLAHHLHTFIESNCGKKFTVLSGELERAEKTSAIRAASLQRKLAVLGIYSTQHRMSESLSNTSEIVTWARGSERYGLGCRCAECMASLELVEDGLPCSKALKQQIPPDPAMYGPPDSTPPKLESSDCFQDHLELFLSAGAHLAAATSAMASSPEIEHKAVDQGLQSRMPDLPSPSASHQPLHRVAEGILPKPDTGRAYGARAAVAVRMQKKGDTSHALQQHLHAILHATAENSDSSSQEATDERELLDADTSEEFLSSFLENVSRSARELQLQSHEASKAEAALSADNPRCREVTTTVDGPGAEETGDALDAASKLQEHRTQDVGGSLTVQREEAADVTVDQAQPPQLGGRGRDTNPQNWKSASNFLRLAEQKVEKTAQHPEIMEEQRLLQRTDLQLQAQAAVLRITAKKMHRRALQAFIQRREADASLELARATERRTRDARQVLGSLQRSSTPRGLQKALTRCVEATVAAFDAERRNAGTKSLTDLDREVARAMQSISRCRRLLLDMVKASPVGSTEPQGLGLGDESRKVFFEPGSKRHKQWADVYADLLQIESKDTSTITLHTVQGIAWAKVAKVPGVPGTASP